MASAQHRNFLAHLRGQKGALARVSLFFTGRRRHTRLQGDWSSDVCSSDLAWAGTSPYRSRPAYAGVAEFSVYVAREARGTGAGSAALGALVAACEARGFWKLLSRIDRKSTRLNSSHLVISYAVFCLEKKQT